MTASDSCNTNTYTYTYTIILIIILLLKNLLMLTILLWLKKLEGIIKLLNLKLMIKPESQSIKYS